MVQPAEQMPLDVAWPEPGGVKRAQLWREALAGHLARPVGFALRDKRRSAGLMGSEEMVAGNVADATVLLPDDLIASGQTMAQAAHALRQCGARRVLCFAGHGLFTGDAARTLAQDTIDAVVVPDTVPAFPLPPDAAVRSNLQVLSVAGLLAPAIADSPASAVPSRPPRPCRPRPHSAPPAAPTGNPVDPCPRRSGVRHRPRHPWCRFGPDPPAPADPLQLRRHAAGTRQRWHHLDPGPGPC